MKDKAGRKEAVKNVIIVSIAAPPYTTPESLQFSKYLKYLSSTNLNLFLVTAKISSSNLGWRKVDIKYRSTLNDLEQVVYVNTYFGRVVSGILRRLVPGWFKKPDNERLFIYGWKKVIRELKVTPDLIYSRSTPISSTLMAFKLQRHYNVPWIMHLSDPWALSPLLRNNGAATRYHFKMEKLCFSAAAKICLTSNEQIDLYQQYYPQYQGKFQLFPNVYDDDEIPRLVNQHTEQLTFVHTGNFYGNWRSPDTLLKAVVQIYNQDPEILRNTKFLFAGFQSDDITKQLIEHEKYGVKYLGSLSIEEVKKVQRSASVLVIIDLNLPAEDAVFFPSKTLDYLVAGKPILSITTPGSTLYRIINKVYGSCFAHDDITGLKKYLIEMVSKHQSKDSMYIRPYQIDKRYSAMINSQRLSELMVSAIEDNQ